MKAVALIGVIALYAGREDDLKVYPEHTGRQPPITARDHELAGHAIAFAAALQRGDVRAACSLAREDAAAELNCPRRPRIPRWLRIPPHHELEVVHSYPSSERARAMRMGLELPPSGSLLELEVVEAGHVVLITTFAVI